MLTDIKSRTLWTLQYKAANQKFDVQKQQLVERKFILK